MPQRIPQSVALRVPLKAYLSADHVSDATGKTLAVTISKNGAAFGNPSAGATNASEIGNGWYYVDLSTTDAGSLGPVVIRAAAALVDAVEIVYQVVDAASLGASNLDASVASRSTYAGADTSGTSTLLGRIPGTVVAQTGDAYARIGAAGAGLTALGDTRIAHLDADVSSRNATTPPTASDIAEAVWGATSRTLSTFGTLVADVVTAVWLAGSRTLSAFAFTPLVTVSDKTGFELTSGYDAAKTAAQAGDAMAVTDKTGYSLATAPPTANDIALAVWAAGTRTLSSLGSVVSDVATAVWAAAARTLTAFDFTVAADVTDKTGYALTSDYDAAKTAAQPGDAPSAADNADKLLGRSLAGSADGGRTVRDALRPSRNKVVVSRVGVTVYAEDDATVAWTGTVSTDSSALPITGVDPA